METIIRQNFYKHAKKVPKLVRRRKKLFAQQLRGKALSIILKNIGFPS